MSDSSRPKRWRWPHRFDRTAADSPAHASAASPQQAAGSPSPASADSAPAATASPQAAPATGGAGAGGGAGADQELENSAVSSQSAPSAASGARGPEPKHAADMPPIPPSWRDGVSPGEKDEQGEYLPDEFDVSAPSPYEPAHLPDPQERLAHRTLLAARRAVPLLGRLAGAALVLITVGGVCAAAYFSSTAGTPLDLRRSARTAIPPTAVELPPIETTMVCAPDPIWTLGNDPQESTPPALSQSRITSFATAPGGSSAVGQITSPLNLEGTRARVLTEVASSQASVVISAQAGMSAHIAPTAERTARATGLSQWVATSGELRGLAYSGCTTPAIESYLVAGSTELSHSARLIIINPGQVASEVSLEIFTERGQAGNVSETLTVPAGGQRSVLVEASAPDLSRIAVAVRATGAPVAAFMQINALDGLDQAGLEMITPSDAPARSVLVPGLELTGEATDAADGDLPAHLHPVIRLVNPGSEVITARLSLLTEDGRQPIAGADAVAVDPGAVFDVPLDGLKLERATVQVEADGVILASGRSVSAGIPDTDALSDTQQVHDIAWSAGRSPAPEVLLAVPQHHEGIADSLTIANPGSDDLEVEISGVSEQGTTAQSATVRIAAGAIHQLQLRDIANNAELSAVMIRAEKPVVAAITSRHAELGMIATISGQSDSYLAHSQRVRIR